MPAYIMTQFELVKLAAQKWKAMYGHDSLRGRPSWHTEEHKAIYERLLKAKTPEEVDSIIGNNGWTTFYCHNCGAHGLKLVIQVGQEWDYESRSCYLCLDCTRKIHESLQAAEGRQKEASEDFNRGHGLDEVSKPALPEIDPQGSS